MKIYLTCRIDERNATCLYAVLCCCQPVMADSPSFDTAWAVFQETLAAYPIAEAWLWESPRESRIGRAARKAEVERWLGLILPANREAAVARRKSRTA